jgi:hypothetical protein
LIVDVPGGVTSTPGTYSVTVFAVDDNGTRTIGPGTLTIVDFPNQGGAPLITTPEFVTAEATSASGAAVSYTVTAQSQGGGALTPNCSPASGSVFSLGPTTVSCSATDANGTTTALFSVVVDDTTPPSITVPDDIATTNSVVTYSVTSFDLVSGSITNSTPTPPNLICSPASGSTFPTGTTTVNCTSTDAHTNSSSASFHVTVGSIPPPTLVLPNDITTEATGPNGAAVTFSATADQGATVVCTPPSGSTFSIDTTTVSCTATNAQGGETTGTFHVTVHDTTKPALSLPANITVQSSVPVVVTYTATSTDIVDGNLDAGCTPASGETFAVGTTTVNCASSDNHGNTATGSFTVTVSQQGGPPPHLQGLIDVITEATGPAGAVVTYTVTATNDGVVMCLPASGSTFAIGTTQVNCTAMNAFGSDSGSFNVTVRDTTPPALTLPSNMVVEATGSTGAVVTYNASASDIVDGNVGVVCTPASGSLFPIATTTVSCTATDSHNNSSSGAFTVTVQDTTAPVVTSITANPGNLWPPDHKMVAVGIIVQTFDAVDPAPVSHIVSVTSNQPINGTGDGDVAPDWVITGPLSLHLRAERASGIDRVYTITVVTIDSSGNSTTSTVTVTVSPTKRRAA